MKARLLQVLAYLVVLAFGNFTWYVAMAVYAIKPGEISFLPKEEAELGVDNLPYVSPNPPAFTYAPSTPAINPQAQDPNYEVTPEEALEFEPDELFEVLGFDEEKAEWADYYAEYARALGGETEKFNPAIKPTREKLVYSFQKIMEAIAGLTNRGSGCWLESYRLQAKVERWIYDGYSNDFVIAGCYSTEPYWAEKYFNRHIAFYFEGDDSEIGLKQKRELRMLIHASKDELEEALEALPPRARDYFHVKWNEQVNDWLGGDGNE